MKTTSIALAICFLGIAVFGFLGTEQAMANRITCVGSLAQSASCPSHSPIAPGLHLDGLKSFSTAAGLAYAWGLLALILVLFSFIYSAPALTRSFNNVRLEEQSSPPASLRAMRAWLTRLEKRDPSA